MLSSTKLPAGRSRPALVAVPATALLLCLVLFAVDAELIASHHAWLVDRPVLTEAAERRDGLLSTVMTAVTYAAEIPLIVVSALVAVVLGRRAHSWRPLVLVGAAGGLSVLAATAAKDLTDRLRPPATYWVVHESGFSFPSRHTTMAAALLPLLAYLLTMYVRSRPAVCVLWAAAFALIGLVGASRVYLGVHWATDVAGGFALGTAVALALITADRARHALTGRGAPSVRAVVRQ
ncbi:phosphatase PAP2 family protein [Streptomyces rimosus]|uniref:phosphatase PAP2 family protein n=1 Tax=Streptomyces rimosus TaxID=1927 RepID=UPI0006B25B4E|nr:phosphatase PAP2 family protein [Streptomyces rimosus]